MAQVKYIAKGFLIDASKLLEEFLERNSLEFSVFADVWKKHHFAFIYAGRESVAELIQFTQEIFKKSTIFLLSSSFKKQVGATFLIYTLYRNQIIEPLVEMRVELPVFRTLKSIREKAIEEKLRSLHYVLDYLFDNALILVAFQTLMGPTVRSVSKRFEPQPFESVLEEFKKSELLEDLVASFVDYGEDRNSSQWLVASGKIKEFMDSGQQRVAAVAAEVNDESAVAVEVSSEQVAVSNAPVGSRRSELNTVQLSRDKQFDFSTDVECPTSEDVEKDRVCKTRSPKKSKRWEQDQKRKMSDEESDDSLSEFLKSKLPTPSIRRRHEKPHRVRRYYKEEPSKGCRQFLATYNLADFEHELFF